ncbi:MAG: LuxR C-terminal-related transcriptional regulator [Duncaniella sp.]|nr:LuxR C-terminal-related transcriptional regulator [Duncaniella sp.]
MKAPVIVIVSSSPVIAAGLTAVIRSNLPVSGAVVVEAAAANVVRTVDERRADIVVGDTRVLDAATVAAIRETAGGHPAVVALLWSVEPDHVTSLYDATVGLFDQPGKIADVLMKCCPGPAEDSRKELSPREKDVIIGVVKGLSNKEIADRLNVSAHTVMTHRRNIASKLQIHSPAGLTIYAIVSHLVSLDEVKETI